MRKQRPDRITGPDGFLSRTDEVVFHSLESLDRTISGFEKKWGIDRLPTLVDVSTASKFASAKAKLDLAIEKNDAEEVAKRAAILQRGWEVMDGAADRDGHQECSLDAWTWRDDDDRPHAFLRDPAAVMEYSKKYPGVAVYTMPEIVKIVAFFNGQTKNMGREAKEVFPGAKITRISGSKFDDDIPF